MVHEQRINAKWLSVQDIKAIVDKSNVNKMPLSVVKETLDEILKFQGGAFFAKKTTVNPKTISYRINGLLTSTDSE